MDIVTVETSPAQQKINDLWANAYRALQDASQEFGYISMIGTDEELADVRGRLETANMELDYAEQQMDEYQERVEAFRAAEISAVMSGASVPSPDDYDL